MHTGISSYSIHDLVHTFFFFLALKTEGYNHLTGFCSHMNTVNFLLSSNCFSLLLRYNCLTLYYIVHFLYFALLFLLLLLGIWSIPLKNVQHWHWFIFRKNKKPPFNFIFSKSDHPAISIGITKKFLDKFSFYQSFIIKIF